MSLFSPKETRAGVGFQASIVPLFPICASWPQRGGRQRSSWRDPRRWPRTLRQVRNWAPKHNLSRDSDCFSCPNNCFYQGNDGKHWSEVMDLKALTLSVLIVAVATAMFWLYNRIWLKNTQNSFPVSRDITDMFKKLLMWALFRWPFVTFLNIN